jgi:hypothetical protein
VNNHALVLSDAVHHAIGNLSTWVGGLNALSELGRSGIPVLIIKSLPQVEELYGHAGGRTTNDIDIVVPAAHMVRAFECLTEHGWRNKQTERFNVLCEARGREGAILARSWQFVSPVGQASSGLDLHSDGAADWYKPAINNGLWKNAVSRQTDGVWLSIASAEDRLVILCCHASREFLEPRIMEDLGRAVGDHELSWPLIAQRARAAGLCSAVAVLCEIAVRRQGRSVRAERPWLRHPELRPRLLQRGAVRLLECWQPGRRSGVTNALLLMVLCDSPRRRWTYLRQSLLPSREIVGEMYLDRLPTWREYTVWQLHRVLYRAGLLARLVFSIRRKTTPHATVPPSRNSFP